MPKVRFYEIETRDGHGSTTSTVPAQKKEHIYTDYESEHVKVTKVKFKSWENVNVTLDDQIDGHMFIAQLPQGEVTIQCDSPSYDFLSNQLKDKVQEVKDYYKNQD